MPNQSLPCPTCNNTITFNAQQLLMGATFSCSKCGATIGIHHDSKPTVLDVLTKLDEKKKQ